MRKSVIFPVFLGVLFFTFARDVQAFTFNPNYIISDSELVDADALNLGQIQSILNRGALGSKILEDHTGAKRTAAEIIWLTSLNVGINPKFLLVLLQKEQSLVMDDSPTDRQLDWATGYAVCDNCSKDDPAIQRWKGFGKQVNSAALQFVDGYLEDIEAKGTTQGKYGPGVEVKINNEIVVPQNAATAALYAYTPHIEGNRNFAMIWEDWFGVNHITGTLLKGASSPDVYLIQYGMKRHITSWSAFISRFNPNLIVEVPDTVLDNYETGRPIAFANYALLKTASGTRYLLVNDTLRPFESEAVYRSIGFVEDELIDVSESELADYEIGETITLKTKDPQGKLLQLSTTGAVFFIENGSRHPIIDKSILLARFKNAPLVKATPVEVEQYKEGSAVTLPDGALIKGPDEVIYMISEGLKRPFESTSVFTSLGFEEVDILTVPQTVLDIHVTGTTISSDL